MNVIVFDVCAIVISAIMLLSEFLGKKHRETANLIMITMISMTLLSALVDMLGILIGNYAPHTMAWKIMVYILNYIYFVAHNLILPCYIQYIYYSVGIWHIYKSKKYLSYIWVILYAIDLLMLVANVWLVDVFSVDNNLQYIRGEMVSVLYFTAIIYAVWGFSVIVIYRKFINRDKFAVLCLLYPIIGLGVMIQFYLPGMDVEMLATSIAMLLFMALVKREENQTNPMTGAINYNQGINTVNRNFMTGKNFTVTFAKIINYSNMQLHMGQDRYTDYLKSCTDNFVGFIREIKADSKCYFMENGLFAFITDGKDKEKDKLFASKINEFLSREICEENFVIKPDKSVCIVRCPEDVCDFTTLFTVGTSFHKTLPKSDGAIEYSKYKDDIDFKIRNEIKDIIERGLRDNRFHMHYQPIYSNQEKRFVAAEALLRLDDEKYGNISPAVFIPMAEMDGSIHDIGDFVLEDVLRFISENDIERMGLRYVEVNLSASQCIESDLVDKILKLLEKYNVPAERLSLQVTENAVEINPEIVDANIRKLHNFGIRIALDDYGTGYSNIKRVTSLPIDEVKLDKTLIDRVNDTNMWIVIKDTISMLKEMGKEILVEGVEVEEVAQKFSNMDTDFFLGCELVQGFYYCKPINEGEFVDFMRKHR